MRHTFNSKIKLIFWTILTVMIGILFASFIFKNTPYRKTINPGANTATVIESLTNKATPKYFYFTKNIKQKPKITAKAYLVGDLDTGEVILNKNQESQFPIASVSKLMTAYVATELIKTNDTAKVSKRALDTYGKNGNFKLGEKVKVADLIYPLLLQSSNDASEIIAEYFNRNTFIKKMNETALKLNLSKTTFKDPSGLSASNQSTVFEMFKLAGYINQKKPELFQTTTKRNYSNKTHNWYSNNQFLQENGYVGGKSGYTDPAQQTVISVFSVPLSKTGTRKIAITLLQSKDRFKDVENILKYIKNNIYYGGEADASTAWVKERSDLSETYDKDFVNLTFGGDIMLYRGVKNSVNKNFNGDYSALFEKLEILKKSDIAFANLEGPASDVGKDLHNLYSFRMDPSVIPALKGAGFSILSVANNHVGDWGREAYIDTLMNLEENEILYTGGGMTEEEAIEPTIIEKYGMKIGYLGFSDVGPEWMKVTKDKAGLLLSDDKNFSEIVKNASKKVDYLIVSIHFGDEYKDTHNQRQQYLAHNAVDAGAKIVIGHHPHVVEDIEVYKNGLIAYSLGNFIFDQGFSQKTMEGMLLEVKLNKDGNMSIKKNIVKLNKFFQPDKVIIGKEEKVKFK